MDCALLEASLTEFLEGELDAETEAAAVEHLATCARCETVLAGTRAVIGLAATHGRVELPGADRAHLLQQILADVSPSENLDL
jgi:anti-sigma factor RsiW